ncbi:MAG: C40 family peptidase [Gordonia sp. (in: high G+C Gram-positive bacteria)]|uniref:C40 family peptidase n=1 Tax=Gordonia sp. (in: high G+C Gram-positive bacteria) TaxID=84139 RepID=UPI0039E628A4
MNPANSRGAAAAATAALLSSVALSAIPTASAVPARNANQLVADYKKLSVEAERSSEAMNNATMEYNKQKAIVDRSRKAAAAAQKKLDTTNALQASLQARVDGVLKASYRGARVNRLYALLVSDSPQQMLDQMSALDVISREATGNLKNLTRVRAAAVQTKKDSATATATANAEIAKVEKVRADLQAKRANLALQAVQIRAVYQSMTGRQLAELRGPKFDFNPNLVPKGAAPALVAVQAALSRVGDPYVWGATGPNQFDCSGLMVWSYRQAGKSLPRSSQAQMGAGVPVSRGDLKPGDLILYYSDAHHVGMYVGDGYVIHASTFGVPVKVVPVDGAGPYLAARRV